MSRQHFERVQNLAQISNAVKAEQVLNVGRTLRRRRDDVLGAVDLPAGDPAPGAASAACRQRRHRLSLATQARGRVGRGVTPYFAAPKKKPPLGRGGFLDASS